MKKPSSFLSSLITCSGVALLLASSGIPTAKAEEKPTSPADMEWFREARFGMFIHWGLYSEAAGEWKGKKTGFGAEWIQERFAVPASEYMPLAKDWNPKNYNPAEWVRQIKAAGVRYICITSKHHDGFCLWPTKLNDDWNISITPYGQDLLKPLAEACRKEGVKFCLYHSVMDWHHPDWTGQSFNDLRKGTPDKERFKKEYLYPQLKELFTNYGEIGMLWLDGTWDKAWTSEDGKELEDYIRTLQPSVVINNRSGYKPPQPKYDFHIGNAYSYIFAGDYISPEGEIPPTGLPGIDWETCQTMQPPKNWGYNRNARFRSSPELLRELVDVTSKGGNLLLNIGPNAEGEIVPEASSRLKDFATWMAVNAESIHGTTASPFEHLPFDGRCTRKGGRLYLHVFDWPKNGTLTVPLTNRATRAFALAEPDRNLPFKITAAGLRISLPQNAPDPVVSVIAVDIEGDPKPLAPPRLVTKDKPAMVSSIWPGREEELSPTHITDANSKTIWAAKKEDRQATVTLDLGEDVAICEIRLSDAPYGRTKEFEVEAKTVNGWKKIAEGTSIGPNLHLSVDDLRTSSVRLNIKKASDTPTLAEFQVFTRDQDRK
jgi:alpha-L-fucosidase